MSDLLGKVPIVKPGDTADKFDPADFVMIRGYPRLRENVIEVQKMYGAKLVPDKEADMIRRLDNGLVAAYSKTGEYPEFLAMPDDASNLYLPIPFIVNFYGVELPVYAKPAWFRCPRHFVIGK